ncbi:response regulator [Hymenobacter bucti]|uniref:Two-component system response regulator n=1 Tax=Hymenobacter bucti TaxID=1844114 RepID=A0ABW4QX44_9BACT
MSVPKLCCTLLVDDDETTNYLNRRLLEKLDVTEQVVVALNGEEALQVLRTQCTEASRSCPALVFLDINMPQMNGFEFLSAYEQLPLPQRGAIVIVMLTTSLHPQDMERLQQFSVAGFLSKPLNKDKVNDVLQAHFRQ